MIRFTHYAAAMIACFAMSLAVQAQQQEGQDAQQAGAQRGGGAMKLDQNFLKQTAIDNQFEIQLSQLAESKAQDQKVKQFAQQLVQDHTKATEQLKQVAQKKSVQLPTSLPETKQEELQIFQSLSGTEFDQAYLSCMKVGHAKSVAAYSEKAKNAKDQDVKQFAAAILPKLQEHKQQVVAMTGGSSDEAQTAGSRQQQSDYDRKNQTDASDASDRSSNSSGTGSHENGAGSRSGSDSSNR